MAKFGRRILNGEIWEADFEWRNLGGRFEWANFWEADFEW